MSKAKIENDILIRSDAYKILQLQEFEDKITSCCFKEMVENFLGNTKCGN